MQLIAVLNPSMNAEKRTDNVYVGPGRVAGCEGSIRPPDRRGGRDGRASRLRKYGGLTPPLTLDSRLIHSAANRS